MLYQTKPKKREKPHPCFYFYQNFKDKKGIRASTFVSLQLWRMVPTPQTRWALYGLERVHLWGKRYSAFYDCALCIGIIYIFNLGNFFLIRNWVLYTLDWLKRRWSMIRREVRGSHLSAQGSCKASVSRSWKSWCRKRWFGGIGAEGGRVVIKDWVKHAFNTVSCASDV